MTTPIGQATTTATTAKPTQSSAKISSDFEAFLKMLTVQMRNQDPLNPVEGADYAVQLATFSGVEQQVKTNDLLSNLSSNLQSTGLASLANWIGREVPAAGPIEFNGTERSLVISKSANASRVWVEVTDAMGTVIDRLDVPSDAQSITWNGLTPSGAPIPHGRYNFETVAIKTDGTEDRAATPVYQQITEVRNGPEGGIVGLRSGREIPAAQITTLRQAS